MKRAALVFLVLAQAVILRAQDFPFERGTLRGLKALFVSVEKVNDEAERAGLSQDQIRTDVELRLRKAGLRVMPAKATDACLYVNVTPLHITGPAGCTDWAFAIHLGLKQIVTLDREKTIPVYGETWGRSFVGAAPQRDFVSFVRDTLGDKTDTFINDYLAANQSTPRKAR